MTKVQRFRVADAYEYCCSNYASNHPKTQADKKRGKTCATESRFVLVLFLTVWYSGASFFKPFARLIN